MNLLESGEIMFVIVESAKFPRVGKPVRIMKRNFLLTILLVIASPALVAAQDTITRDEYWQLVRGAYAKARGLSSRKVQSIRSTWNGKETQEKWTYINQPPDRVHYINVVTKEAKTSRTEQINIGTTRYCKRDGEGWTITQSYCIPGGGIGGPSNIIKEVYEKDTTKLNERKVTLLRNYTLYLNKFSKTVDTDGPSYSESKYWLNSDGLIVRLERRTGLASNSKPNSVTIETYEYDPTIKIEAPIK